jgi:hypothetical protein
MRIVRLANFVGPHSGGLRTSLRELGEGYPAAGHTRGTAWLLRRSTDLVPMLAALAIREWLSAYNETEERELVPVGENPSA